MVGGARNIFFSLLFRAAAPNHTLTEAPFFGRKSLGGSFASLDTRRIFQSRCVSRESERGCLFPQPPRIVRNSEISPFLTSIQERRKRKKVEGRIKRGGERTKKEEEGSKQNEGSREKQDARRKKEKRKKEAERRQGSEKKNKRK